MTSTSSEQDDLRAELLATLTPAEKSELLDRVLQALVHGELEPDTFDTYLVGVRRAAREKTEQDILVEGGFLAPETVAAQIIGRMGPQS